VCVCVCVRVCVRVRVCVGQDLGSPLPHLCRGQSPRRHICEKAGRTAATHAGTATLPHLHRDWASSGLPRIFRRAYRSCEFRTWSRTPSVNNQRRRVWSILRTVVDLCRCHDGTATVIQFDSDGRPTVRIALSLRAIRMHRPRRLHVLQFAIVRSALGRIHKRDASRKHRASLFRSPPFNILNLLPRRN
jgi:hypothetical protein